MKTRISLSVCRRKLNVSIACLLSFSLFTMPFIPMASAMSRLDSQASSLRRNKSSQAQPAAKLSLGVNIPVAAPAPEPFAPVITATKVDALINDDGDNKADPGPTEKIEYTVTISNTGTTDATNVQFTDTIDPHTTLVGGSITTQPIAVNDSFSALGNVRIQVPDGASDLLANDCDPNPLGGPCTNAGLTITTLGGDNSAPFAGTSAQGGQVTATTGDGSFQYNPAPGFTGSDSFTYTVTDGTGKTDTATVSITVSGMVWFINSAAPAGGDGRLTNAFNCYTGAGCFSAVAADDPGDNIFLFNGTYTGGNVLLANQKLIGQGAKDTLQNISGVTVPTFSDALPATNNTPSNVTISTALAAVNAVNLGTGNVLRGFTVGNVGTGGAGIVGVGFGTLTISGPAAGNEDVAISSNGQALGLNNGAIANRGFLSTSSSGGTSNVILTAITGTLNLGTGTLSGASGNSFDLIGGTATVNYSGGITKSSGTGAMVSITGAHSAGTVTFQTGTLNATAGTGFQFDNADGTYNFNGTNTLAGGDAGVDILNGSSGTFSFSASSTITSPTGTAFNVGSSPGNPTVTYSGTITQNTAGQRAVNIDGTTGGSVSITTVTAGSVAGGVANTGVNVNNANGSVTFTNLNLGTSGTRMTAQALTITGGSGSKTLGTLSIFTSGAQGIVSTNSTGTISTTTGEVNAVNAAAVNIVGTSSASRAPLNMNLTKVNATGSPGNGIILTNVNGPGASVGFVVNGDGTNTTKGGNGTGGTIANTTGADGATTGIGIRLENADEVTFRRMQLNDHSNFAIRGFTSSNITLEYTTINGTNGTSASSDDSSIFLTDTTGTNNLNNNILQGGWENTVRILNTGATVLTHLTLDNNTISQTATTEGNDALQLETQGTSQQTFTVTDNLLTAAKGDLIDCTTGFGSTMTIAFKNNAVSNNHSAIVAAGGGSKFSSTGTLNIDIDGNTFRDAVGNLLFINASGTASPGVEQGVVQGYIRNNTFGVAGVANSGSTSASTLQIESNGGGDDTLVVSNNQAFQYNNHGIFLSFVDDQGKTANINMTIDGNTVNTPGTVNTDFNGFHLNNGATSGPPAPGDDFSSCVDIKNNNFTGGGKGVTPPNNGDVRLRQRIVTTVRLPGYTGANNDNAAVVTYLRTAGGGGIKNNSFGAGAAANTVSTGGGGFVNTAGGAPCTQPSFASLSAPLTSDGEAAVNSPVQKQQHTVAVENKRPEASVAKTETRSQNLAQANVKATDNASSRVAPKSTSKPASIAKAQPVAKAPQTHSHHARIVRPMNASPAPMAGETVGPILIGTLRPGDSVVITFQVFVNDPPNLSGVPPGPAQVENQGSVSYAENPLPVKTDDPAVVGSEDKTATPVDLFNTSTALVSNLNPSNFGDNVTFTATVSETPVQASADPTGTVDFIDTSNANAVICNDVPLSSGSAQCSTSTLTAGTHNIRADYSGDGNFDPSQSNIVAQVVIACTPNPIVTSTADNGAGTLREAVANVCTGTTITFNLPGAGPHTITLTTGELPVAKNVTINNNSGESITVSGNNASRVFNINSGKTVSIIGLTISGGNASNGGGVLNDGTLTIVNSTLSGNTATSDGAGVGNTATATSLTLINTTISGNTANGFGGGVDVLGGTATIINATITNNHGDNDNTAGGGAGGLRNQGGTVTMHNTIVAGNFSGSGTGTRNDIQGALQAASSNNLIGDGTNMTGITDGVNGNQVGSSGSPINPQLGSLANNGGLTQTHALLSTSTAIEAGSNAALPVDTFDLDGDANTAETLPVDQRGTGFPRVADSSDANVIQTVDIGAFELHPSIEDIPNQSTNEDTTKNVTFNLGDDTGALIATVAATSSNTTLVPNANLSFTGSGGSRTLQIIPAANQSGTTTITVTVTATNGRTATDTFDLTVNTVNDPPSGTDNTVSTAEDTAYTFTAADFGFTDPNDTPPNTLLAVKITTLPALGTLTNNNVAVNAGDFIPVANITGGLLKFTPAANGNGTPYTSFTFQVQDNGGGTDLDPTPNTMTINVTAVNDGPTNTVPGPQNTNEDTALVFSSGNANQISVADPDAGANPVKITLTATNGTITLSTTAGLSFITGDGTADATMMFTGTLTAVNTALNGMSFTPTANFSGAASLQIVSDDQGNTGTGGPLTDTDSVNITVNAVNDPPSGTDNTVSTAEDTAYTFTAADFGFTDPNDTPPNTLLAVKITTLPALGTLTNNNVAVNAGDFIPVANITGGLLKFTPAANGNGTPYTSFTFQVQDNGGGTDLDPTPNTMTINVTAVNDGPTNTVPGPQNTNEDTALVFSSGNANQISVADPDAGANPVKITLTATNGTITLSTTAGLSFITGDGTADATMMFTGTLTAINTALNGMSFNPTADFNGPASLQIVSDDQGNTGTGGPLTDTDTVNITVNAQNDAPVVTTSVGNTTFTENGAAVAVDNALTVTDGDSPNLVSATVAITGGFVSAQDTLAFSNTANITGNYVIGTGVLTLTGSDTVANYQAALRSVTYSNSSDNPTASRTVSFTVNDGLTNSNTATKGITINAVNDGPVNTVPGPQSTNQNTPLTFSSGNGNQISVADLDAGTNSVQITLTATNGTITLSGTAGLAFTVGDGTADATMTFTGTLANINTALNGMTFTPTNGFSGAASVTITSNDQGNTGSGGPLSDTDTVNIQVSNNITIQDAQVVEPSSGTVNMIFTVTLSAPAPAGGVSVNFTTQDQAPAINHATAGADYTTTAGTVSFAVGEQMKTILVPVKSDNQNSEVNETFLVVLSSPVNGTIADGTATGTILVANQPGAILISELRTSGPGGAGDDFVEIYNNSDSPHTVNGTNGGYGLYKMGATCSATPILIGLIPNGTVIPGRGHYLFVGSAYSLANYGGAGAAAGDQTMSQDIESDRNVAIFSTGTVVLISSANRLDAVGFGANTGGTCDLLREGTTLTPMSGSVLEYSFFRDECGKSGNPAQFGPCPTNGFMADTNVNDDDFIFVDTTAASTPAGQLLGAPGPQNLASARFTINVGTQLLDATIGNTAPPNRVRDFTVVPNGANGTMSVRRRFVNNTGAPVTKLKFRIVDFTSLGTSGIADLRVLSSGSVTVSGIGDAGTCQASNGSPTTPCTVTVLGTTLETPPTQAAGGAMNSSVNAGTITLGTPLAPGASINLQILLGVQATGSFKFFFNVEALP